MKKTESKKINPRLNDYGAFEYRGMKLLPYRHHQHQFLWMVLVLMPYPKEEEIPDEKVFETSQADDEDDRRREFRYMVVASSAQEAAKEGVLAYRRNHASEKEKKLDAA